MYNARCSLLGARKSETNPLHRRKINTGRRLSSSRTRPSDAGSTLLIILDLILYFRNCYAKCWLQVKVDQFEISNSVLLLKAITCYCESP